MKRKAESDDEDVLVMRPLGPVALAPPPPRGPPDAAAPPAAAAVPKAALLDVVVTLAGEHEAWAALEAVEYMHTGLLTAATCGSAASLLFVRHVAGQQLLAPAVQVRTCPAQACS